jgi:hypothetical protein
MSIQDNIVEIIQRVLADQTGQLGEDLRRMAIDAIYGGPKSDQWRDYMKNFVNPPDDPIQLARLTGVDDKACAESPYIREARAYLIANATCGTPTFKTTTRGVDDVLDKSLPIPGNPTP